MKTLLLALSMLITFSICKSQILEDYPFKTFLDDDNNLYVTGCEQIDNTKDIFIAKYPPSNGSNPLWKRSIINISGDDRGLDLVVDDNGFAFITGYVFNNITSSNDIIVISLFQDGTVRWSKTYNNPGDDKGMGIDISLDEIGEVNEVFVSGYITNPTTGKDLIVKKFNANNGNTLWQSVYSANIGDDIATDILLDAGFAYVVGYTYANNSVTSDIMIQSYHKNNGQISDNNVYLKPGSNEKPTGFVIPLPSFIPISKSRSSIVSITDEIIFGQTRTRYLTISYDPDRDQKLVPRWSSIIGGSVSSPTNIPTAITSDNLGDIYVTGYMFNPAVGANNGYGYDFATVKYDGDNGTFKWNPGHILYNDFNNNSTTGVDDKATSVKVNFKKQVLVAGTSQGSPNGYSYSVIQQTSETPHTLFSKAFVPNFLEQNGESIETVNMNKSAILELTSDGTPIMIVMGWTETESHWAAVKYDSLGNEEYTINNEPEKLNASEIKNETEKNRINISNYPNPFNPSTVINYETGIRKFISIIVYDMLGREVATLVNETKDAGKHKVTFNANSAASGLSSGIYYYTISADGIMVDTKSMVLMK